jgi:hypothetical protein
MVDEKAHEQKLHPVNHWMSSNQGVNILTAEGFYLSESFRCN